MSDEYERHLRQRFDYEAWPAPQRTEAQTVRPEILEAAGLRRLRTDTVAVPGARAAFQTLSAAEGGGERLVRVDLIEMADDESARSMVLSLLGEFQSPELRRAEHGVGQLSFEMPAETAVLFVRGNVVVMLRNAGSEVIPLGQYAAALDSSLRARAE